MRRILSFAVFLFVLCLLSIPMPTRTAGPPTLQPNQAPQATATVSPPSIRLAAVIVKQLLPATAGAQAVATAAPQRSHGHGVLIAIILILLFLAIGAGSWFLSKRGSGSGFSDPPGSSANKRAT